MSDILLKIGFGQNCDEVIDVRYPDTLTGSELTTAAATALHSPPNPDDRLLLLNSATQEQRWVQPELPISSQLASGDTVVLIPSHARKVATVYRPRESSHLINYNDLMGVPFVSDDAAPAPSLPPEALPVDLAPMRANDTLNHICCDGRLKRYLPTFLLVLCLSYVLLLIADNVYHRISHPERSPLAVVDFHVDATSCEHAALLHSQYLQNDRFVSQHKHVFRFRFIAAKTAGCSAPLPVSEVNCPDGAPPSSCAIDASYRSFAGECPKCGWLVRADGSTWISAEHLYRYITALEEVYSPRKHLVFRAHALNATRDAIGGAAVMSWAFVRVHAAANVTLAGVERSAGVSGANAAETLIVRKVFPHVSLWDDLAIAGFPCANCGESASEWKGVRGCTNGTSVVRLSDMIAVNASRFDQAGRALMQAVEISPEGIGLMRRVDEGNVVLCRIRESTKVWDPEKRNFA